MISLKTAEEIHNILVHQFGGALGVRDLPALESALARPFQKFDNVLLYSDPIHQAAALIESIIVNHPFVDGNKRTGYVLMRLFLLENNFDIRASQEEKYEFVITIASGNKSLIEIVGWLLTHTSQKNIS